MIDAPLEKLLPETKKLLLRLGEAADSFGCSAYIVGGLVRDLLRGHFSNAESRVYDIDVMIEGDAGQFAHFLQERWESYLSAVCMPKKPVVFPKYGTAKLNFSEALPAGVRVIDFSSARRESYPVPGGRPVVEPGDLRADLGRRDFSINAMAVGINGESKGKLIDYFWGAEHLRSKRLSVLHEKSFLDDPARLLRGLRFSVRFGFFFDKQTEKLFNEAVKQNYLASLPRARLFDEFGKALAESSKTTLLESFENSGILAQLHPQLLLTKDSKRVLAVLEQIGDGGLPLSNHQPAEAALAAILPHRDTDACMQILASLELPERKRKELCHLAEVLHERAY